MHCSHNCTRGRTASRASAGGKNADILLACKYFSLFSSEESRKNIYEWKGISKWPQRDTLASPLYNSLVKQLRNNRAACGCITQKTVIIQIYAMIRTVVNRKNTKGKRKRRRPIIIVTKMEHNYGHKSRVYAWRHWLNRLNLQLERNIETCNVLWFQRQPSPAGP